MNQPISIRSLVCIWITVLMLVSGPVGGQTPYAVQHYTIRDGLLQGGAYYMLKDSRRYLWFMSQEGITRFDGTQFVNYISSRTDPGSGPTGETGSGLAEDGAGDLWFGTEKCLNHYIRATNRFTSVFTVNKQGEKISTPTYVIAADSARVWYINGAEGLLSLDLKTGARFQHSEALRYNPNFDNEYIKHQPARQEIWLLLPDNGVMSFNYKTKKIRSFFSQRSDNKGGEERLFSALYPAPDGTIWLANADVLTALDPDSGQTTSYPMPRKPGSGAVAAIESDGQGNLWLATATDGIYRFDRAQRKWTGSLRHDPYDLNSLATNAVSELLIDREGVAWVNTDPVGLDKLTLDTYGIRHYDTSPLKTPSLNTPSVLGVIEDKNNNIWISLYMGGIDVLNPRTERIIHHYASAGPLGKLPAQSLHSLYADSRGVIWAGAGNGLCRYDESTDSFVQLPITWSNPKSGDYRIRAIIEADDGQYFIATVSGLYRFDVATNRMALLADSATWFTRTLHYDRQTNHLYAGRRRGGMVAYKVNDGGLREDYATLSTLNIQDIRPDVQPSRLWVCTNNGLYLLRAADGHILRSWHEKDGLPHRVVYSCLPDKNGNRWISTNRGMAVLNPATGSIRRVRSIEPTEFNNESFLATRSGEFYFGSTTGLYRFDPLRQTPRQHALQVNFAGLFINDRSIRTDSSLTELHHLSLQPDQRTLTLQFNVVDYFSNGQNRYRYRLTGYDKNWVESDAVNIARYVDLPPGSYLFEVLAADAEGRWMELPRQLSVTVIPPFWRTYLFTVCALFLVLGIGYAGSRAYLRGRLRRQRREFQLQTASQLAERERLARDLHDNIGPDVVALKLQLEAAREELKEGVVMTVLDRVISQADRIVADVRQISHALMPVDLQQRGLSDALELFIQQINSRQKGPEISFTYSLDTPLPGQLQQSFLQITKELVNNALKHAHASLIDVEIYQVDQKIYLVVSDNGLGYLPERIGKNKVGIGLRNIRTAIQRIRGKLVITPKPDGGMRHQIIVPA